MHILFFFSSRSRNTICALVTGVQTCALPIWPAANGTVDANRTAHVQSTCAFKPSGINMSVYTNMNGITYKYEEKSIAWKPVLYGCAPAIAEPAKARSEVRRVGKEWVSTVRTGWAPYD